MLKLKRNILNLSTCKFKTSKNKKNFMIKFPRKISKDLKMLRDTSRNSTSKNKEINASKKTFLKMVIPKKVGSMNKQKN